MDPIHLRLEEIDYELNIRGIFDTNSTIRVKTAALRDFLKDELMGICLPPDDSSDVFLPTEEIYSCIEILESIEETLESDDQNRNCLFINESHHRLQHLQDRIKRIKKTTSEQQDILNELSNRVVHNIEAVVNLIERSAMSKKRTSRVKKSNNVDFSVPPIPPRLSLQSAISTRILQPTRHSDSNSRTSNAVGNQTSTANHTLIDFLPPSERSKEQDNVTRLGEMNLNFSGAEDLPVSSPTLSPIRRSCPNGNASPNRTLLNPFTNAQRGETINRQTYNLDIPTNARKNVNFRNMTRPTTSSSTIDRIFISDEEDDDRDYPLRDRRSQPKSTLSNLTERLHLSIIKQVDREQEIARLQRKAKHVREGLRQQSRWKDLNYCNEKFEPRLYREQPEVHRQNPYRYTESASQFERINPNPQNDHYNSNRNQYQRDSYSDHRTCTDSFRCGEHRDYLQPTARTDSGEAERDHRRSEQYRTDRNQSFGQYRKSVPVNQWRVRFNGEGKGLHLYEFLSQITMLKQAERVSDDELMYSIVHLLTGRAEKWFESVQGSYGSYVELVDMFKKEFLPRNYSYTLLGDIANRRQRPNESFGEFITHMKSLFKWLSFPLDEPHKVHLVRTNLLPKYSLGIAPLGLTSLDQLSEACRNIDDILAASNKTSIPFDNNSYAPTWRKPERSYKPTNVHEIEDEYESDKDIYAMRRVDKRAEARTSTKTPSQTDRVFKCWNCNQTGHTFRDCKEDRVSVFCFRCGEKGVITRDCSKCSGNQLRNPSGTTDRQDSTAQGPQ